MRLLLLLLVTAAAHAASVTAVFVDEPLGRALQELARQAGVTVDVPADAREPVSGRFSGIPFEQAARLLLPESRQLVVVGPDAWWVSPLVVPSPSPLTLPDFYRALSSYELVTVRRMLAAQPALANAQWQDWTPLGRAAGGSCPELVELLLDAGANPTALCAPHGEPPVVLAARSGNAGGLRLLLKRGAPVGPAAQEVQSLCLGHQGTAILKILLDAGVSPNVRVGTFGHPLIYGQGVSEEVLPTARLLLERGADVNARGAWDRTPLQSAASLGPVSLCRLFLEWGADPNLRSHDGLTPMHEAAARGSIELMQMLEVCGAELEPLDQNDRSPLQFACWHGQCESIRYLADRGCALNGLDCLGQTPLHWAAEMGKLEAAQLLVARGASCLRDDNGKSPADVAEDEKTAAFLRPLPVSTPPGRELLKAVRSGKADRVRELLASGADPGFRSRWGRTLLHEAPSAEISALLLAAGVPVDARDANGSTSLLTAGNEAKALLLLARGADVNAEDFGFSALGHAASEGWLPVVEKLLDRGARLDMVTRNDAWTPLHSAAYPRHLDVVRLLIARGASTNARTFDGKTPLDVARESERDVPLTPELEEALRPR